MVFTRRSAGSIAQTALLLCLAAAVASPQASSKFTTFLSDRLDAAEIGALGAGEIVVKILPSADKREISVFGCVKVRSTKDVDMAAFRESFGQRSNKAMLDGGRFSSPPALRDIEDLKLEDRDIEDMQRCVIGNCGVKLSAEMISALENNVDWNSPDSKQRATEVFRQAIVDLVHRYAERGDTALADYVDHKRPIRPADENKILLDDSPLIRELAPEFENYLRKYPALDLAGVESRLDWTNVSSGLKPILTITHGTSYSKAYEDVSALLIVTKQIYASHYVDASLAVSAFVRIGVGEQAENYLVFTNISRSDALGGALSGIAHTIAEGEAKEKVTDLIARAKYRLEANSRGASEPRTVSGEDGILAQLGSLTRNWLFGVVALVFVVVIAIVLFRRRSS